MRYENKFYNPKAGTQKFFDTDVKPVEYKGYLIVHRIKSNANGGNVYDIVTADGICIKMFAGIMSAKRMIDWYCEQAQNPCTKCNGQGWHDTDGELCDNCCFGLPNDIAIKLEEKYSDIQHA